ncbi:response regulator [Micromonospora sp. NPDC049679]|uniref:response regulator transcription factor n=1 Tax=Micromonospora sp. NPDC049679 TaxID=3155920 RepID=UPI0033D70915
MTTVLIAEDDEDIRDLVVFKLEQAGFTVIAAPDGTAALAAAQAQTPDLAVIDVSMPQLSGLDLCRLLRADPRTAGTLIIMLTARSQEGDVEAGFSAGADDYIVKPFSPRELTSRIRALMQRHGREEARRSEALG